MSKVSYWDALIVETAADSGATLLVTEDLQHGQSFGELRVVNPFHEESSVGGTRGGSKLNSDVRREIRTSRNARREIRTSR